jgi:hypothetical protein
MMSLCSKNLLLHYMECLWYYQNIENSIHGIAVNSKRLAK